MQQLIKEKRSFYILANRLQSVNHEMQHGNQQSCPPIAPTHRKQPRASKCNQRMDIQMPRFERIVGLVLAGSLRLQVEVAEQVRQKLQYEEFDYHGSKFNFS